MSKLYRIKYCTSLGMNRSFLGSIFKFKSLVLLEGITELQVCSRKEDKFLHFFNAVNKLVVSLELPPDSHIIFIKDHKNNYTAELQHPNTFRYF